MATTIVSVSFFNGFVGNATKNNEASNASYLTALGWSNFQFQQATDNGQFGGTQGNDLSGTLLITDAAGVQHRIQGVINWRAPSGSVSTMVFYATGTTNTTMATNSGTYVIDPFTEANGDPHSFIGLTFNGQTLNISGGTVTGNAATSGLLTSLNTYLANQPQLTVGDATVNEGAGSATVTVTLNKTSTDTVTVKYTTVNGTAVAGTDYTAKTGTLTFAPGETSKQIVVPVIDNATVDGARAVSVVLSDSSFAAITDNTGVITINDNDTATPPVIPPVTPAATVAAVIAEDAAHTGQAPVDGSVTEGGTLVYSVTLNGAGGEHTLAIGGTADAGDRGAIVFSDGVTWKNGDPATGIVVVPSGVGSFKITVATLDDSAIESAETLVLTVGGVQATGTVTDNDSQSVTSVIAEDAAHTGASPVDSSVAEGASLLFTVALNVSSPAPVEYTLSVGGTAGAADIGSFVFSNGVAWKNGDPASGIVVVPAGVVSFTATLPTVDDNAIESTETAILSIGGVSATGTITDNDSQSVTSVLAEDAAHTGASPVDSSVVEGASLLYTIALNVSSPAPVEYALSLSGTASSADLGALSFSNGVAWKNGDPATGIVVVPAGVSSFTAALPTVDDSAVEHAESAVLTIGGVSATGTITDNDSVSVSAVLAEDAANLGAIPLDSAVIEGASLRYTVQLSAAGVAPTELSFAVGGTASAADIGAMLFSDGVVWKNGDPATGIVVVPAGVVSFKVTIATVDDTAVEQTESLVLSVGGVQGTGTITDNDSVSVASVIAEDAAATGLSPVDSTVTEGGILRYSVLLNTATIASTELVLAFGGTAEAADLNGMVFSDGVAWKNNDPHSGIVVVPAGVGSFKLTVATLDDSAIEHTESLTLTVGGVASTGTIVDNDSQAVTSLVAENAAHRGATPVDSNVVEGGALLFTATLNGASPAATEYTLALGGSASSADLGALAFSDGVAWKNGDPHSGIVVVPAGVSSFTATLDTVDDAAVESTETVSMTIGGVLATGTIADNDSLNVSAVTAEDAANAGQNPADSAITEGATLVYTVTLNAAAVAPTEFSLVLGGTASDADVGVLAFSDGVTWKNGDAHSGIVVVPVGVDHFTVTVPTVDDSIVESSESAVLSVNGIHATGTIVDNDQPVVVTPPVVTPPVVTPPMVTPPVVVPTPAPDPVPTPAPAPVLQGKLDPATDDGASSTDTVTSVRTPDFTISGGQLLSAGGSVRLLSPAGELVSTSAVSAADAAAGKISLSPGALDDGVYTYTVQVLDAGGKVVGSTPVSVTIVTDLDGVMPSVELAAYGGDYNKDGVLDWQQNGVALLPLGSLADFAKGVNAPVSSFGAVIAGSAGTPTDTVHLTSGAQLRDLSLTDLPKSLSTDYRAASPVFNFTVTATEDAKALPDLDPTRPGLQTRVVIELGQTGVASNDFMKFDKATGTWFSYLDDQNLATFDDGATLVDLNGDGRVDRIVITLTDGGRGDEDGVANGVIVDPGLLAFNKVLDQVYSVRMASGELYYTADVKDAQTHAAGTGNLFQGVVFDSMTGQAGTQHLSAYYQPFTQDTTYAAKGGALPYACYELLAGSAGFDALGANSGVGVGIHLYQDNAGHTELMTAAQAQQQGLLAKGYTDRGAKFNATMDNAFNFDAEGYLLANHDNAAVQALVQQLAASYQSTSAAGFIEAVEQNYFQQIQLVGVAHGAAATAADLNALFGTHFGN